MTQLSITILSESPEDAPAVERLNDHAFGPGRYARAAFRLREGGAPIAEVSFIARVGTLLVGSVRLSPITIGDTPALVLGPLTVDPDFRSRGIGGALVRRALEASRKLGHRLVLLVGDEPYYSKLGFTRVPRGRVVMPGPVDKDRILIAELEEGAFEGVSGAARPAFVAVTA
ncbi:GNAT family N-acetyltransferase [Blastochloris viridis]|uniref:PhnO protein n=1 Tax=Blastochloris viridis TaxID=1079 RepID=A0A0H5BPS6_BLAVI|nr:N-acetyltransferase [Blastochloris viridis]ALK10265.1 Acetyltransferase (GNAT) family protein [Blastochloris viridis]BAR99803.1 PhnO protein [Blastochloris viridis]CUU42927.1 putative acetyltransferase [Blastochloris viridis]